MPAAGANGRFGKAFEILGVERAWTRTRGDPGVVVAILSAAEAAPGPAPDRATAAEGMAIAGIAAARASEADGVAGIAPHVRLVPVRFGDGAEPVIPDLARAIELAVEAGASIIHIPASANPGTSGVARAVQYAAARNALVVCAANPSIAALRSRVIDDPVPNQISVLSVSEQGVPHAAHADASGDIAAPAFARVPSPDGAGHATLDDAAIGGAYVVGCAALLKSLNPGWGYHEIKEHLLVSGSSAPQLARAASGRALHVADAVLGPLELAVDGPELQWSALNDAIIRWRLRYRSAYCLNAVTLYRRHGDEHWRELGYARASTGQMTISASVMRRSAGMLRIACRESNFHSDEVPLVIR